MQELTVAKTHVLMAGVVSSAVLKVEQVRFAEKLGMDLSGERK